MRTPGPAPFLAFVTAVACALLLYLPWRSIQFDLNGVDEAASVEAGTRLLSPNHLLFRPLAAAAYALLRAGGYEGLAIGPCQVLSALFGALAVGFALIAYRELGASPATAAMAAALLAVSWAHWVFSTDVHYISLAAMLAAAALAAAAGAAGSTARAAGAGTLAALATLAWQGNVFLLPALAIGVAGRADGPLRLRAVALFLGSAGAALLVSYGAAAAAVGAAGSVGELLRWSTSYAGSDGPPLAMYGRWSVERIGAAAVSWVASVIAVWDGLGLRALAQGSIQPAKLLPQLSLAALALLAVVSAGRLLAALRRGEDAFAIGWMLAAFGLFLPLIVWWEPFNPRWFIVPNLFVAGALAVAWRGERRLLGACIAVIAAANFSAAIWPRHTRRNPGLDVAYCVAQRLQPADLFLVSDWEWFGYAAYFHRYAGSSLWLIDRRGRETKRRDIARQAEETRRRGGRVYGVDVSAYADDRAAWLLEQTELSVADFASLAPAPAFECAGVSIVELRGPS